MILIPYQTTLIQKTIYSTIATQVIMEPTKLIYTAKYIPRKFMAFKTAFMVFTIHIPDIKHLETFFRLQMILWIPMIMQYGCNGERPTLFRQAVRKELVA